MKKVQLVFPSAKYREAYLGFYQEWVDSKEKMVPWVIAKNPSDFEGMLSSLEKNHRGENLPAGRVPDSTFWLVSDEGEVLGVVNIRHALTDELRKSGGHIGYGLKPSARKKGYAVVMLELALQEAAKLGIEQVLVVCDKENIASAKTIEKNGGVRDEDYIEADGSVVNRYWIET